MTSRLPLRPDCLLKVSITIDTELLLLLLALLLLLLLPRSDWSADVIGVCDSIAVASA